MRAATDTLAFHWPARQSATVNPHRSILDHQPAQLVVVWRVYEHCGLRCRFCGFSRELVRPRRTARSESVLAFGRVLADYQQATGRSVLVSWLGGEPLQWADLERLSHTFRRTYGLRLGVTTNGVPLGSADTRAVLQADYEQLTVSVDGLAAFHDVVRDSPGLFQRVRADVLRLRASDPKRSLLLRVNTVLMRGNIEAFPAFCAEMATWGFDELTFNQLGGHDRPEFYPANRLLPQQVERFERALPALRRRMSARGMRIRGSARYVQRIGCTSRGERIAIDDCRPGERFLFIDEHERVSPCSFTCEGYGVPLAEIDSAETLAELPARFARLRRQRRLDACDDCHSTHVFDKFREPANGSGYDASPAGENL